MRLDHQMGWRQVGWGGKPLGWRERAALAVLVIAAIPLLLLILAVLIVIGIGAGVVGLAAWGIARLLLPRPTPRRAPSVIETDYTRVEEPRETGRPASGNPWDRP